MITETIFALGSWQVELGSDTPVEVVDEVKFFGHVVVTESWVDPKLFADADLLALSTYTGIVRERVPVEDGFTIGGVGMIGWLGDEGGYSYIYEQQRTYTNQTFATTIDRSTSIVMDGAPPGMIRDDSGNQLALRAGTINTVAGTYSGKHYLMNPRQSLEYVMAQFETEWRTNYDGTIDFGTRAQLYQTTPEVIAVRTTSGSDPNWDGLPIREMTSEQDVTTYATKVVLARSGGSVAEGTIEVAESIGSIDPNDPIETLDMHGGALTRVAVVNEPAATADNAQALADAALNNLNKLHETTRLNLSSFDISGSYDLGDTIYIYDPTSGFVNADNEVRFRGNIYYPAESRIVSMSRPFNSRMGVYYRDGSGNYTDLTSYIQFENSDVTIDVGDPLRNLLSDETQTIIQGRTADGGEYTDSTIPKPPTNLTTATSYYVTEEGVSAARIDTDWDAVTLNTDDSSISDGSHYEVRWQQTSSQAMRPSGDVSTGSWGTTPLWSNLDETTPSDSDYIELVI